MLELSDRCDAVDEALWYFASSTFNATTCLKQQALQVRGRRVWRPTGGDSMSVKKRENSCGVRKKACEGDRNVGSEISWRGTHSGG